MKKIGIVVEYNPFHNGHLYQIKQIKKIFGENSLIVIVMSGDYVQRGEKSFFNKWEKTEIALEYGVDLIVELPVYYAIQNAEIFALMSTQILNYMEMDFQCFGVEEDKLQMFYDIVKLQKTEEYNNKLSFIMKKGNSYLNSHKKVLEEYGYNNFIKSNNILALEYIRTIENKNLKLIPFLLKRQESEYQEIEIDNSRKNFVSSTYIRKVVEEARGKNDLNELKNFIPKYSYEIVKDKKSNAEFFKKRIFEIVKYRLLVENKKDVIEIYDLTEEIYDRMLNTIIKVNDYSNFIKSVKSRNFSIKRIERIMLNIFLNIKKTNYEIDYIRVLGFNNRGKKYLKELKRKGKNNIFVNWKDIEKNLKAYNDKIKIEKNVFFINKMFFYQEEKLNPLIKND